MGPRPAVAAEPAAARRAGGLPILMSEFYH